MAIENLNATKKINMDKILENIKVLVIDDDDIVLTVMRSALTSEGCIISTCSGGLEALDQLKTIHESYDLIILDYIMPDLNGNDVLARIRSYEKNNNLQPIPIFSHSGHIIMDERDKLIEMGYTDIFVKPVDLDDLVKKIAYYLKK